MKSVVIIGSNGQLGSDLVKIFQKSEWKVNSLTHSDIQVEDLDSVQKSLTQCEADWIINTAAYHKVDDCEKNPEKSWLVNAQGPQNVAQVALALNSKAVFISTDFVFSGEIPIESAYQEDDVVSPINVYGHSKAAGEIATLATDSNNIVVRISSVFGSQGSYGKGGNFVETILEKARNGVPLNVVNDIHMSPTYTSDVSEIILKAMDLNYSGILHGANSGSVTWFEFAREILKLSGSKIQLSESQTNWESTPKRPKNSALSAEKSIAILGARHSWQDGLSRYLKQKGHIE